MIMVCLIGLICATQQSSRGIEIDGDSYYAVILQMVHDANRCTVYDQFMGI